MNKPTRFYSKKQETKVAKSLQGKRTANSGATKFSKGDVRTKLFLVECKTSTRPKKSITIQKEWLEKLEEEAFAMNKPYNALTINFGEFTDYYVIEERLFKKLVRLLEEEE